MYMIIDFIIIIIVTLYNFVSHKKGSRHPIQARLSME